MRIPDFIIIGAQKSASSFVQACLSEHPDIHMPNGESSCFESPDFENGEMGELFEYLKKQQQPICGIKRPNIIGRMEAVDRINKYCPESKIIAVLRDPIDRLISSYYHLINYGFLPPLNIEEGVARLLDDVDFNKQYPRGKEIFEYGLYYKYLSHFKMQKDKSHLLVFLHGDMKTNPVESIKQCFNFIGVDDNYLPNCMESRPQKVTYSLPRLRFMQLRNRVCYEYNTDRTRLWKRQLNLFGRCYLKGFKAIDRLLLAHIYQPVKPELSPSLTSRLRELYQDDIAKLELFIGRDLASWK